MVAIKNLSELISKMTPEHSVDKCVFCSVSKKEQEALVFKPLMTFQEEEGVTLILDKEEADQKGLSYNGIWSQITLTVNSDLQAVGFLAAITEKLADAGISVNAVSAYYHDHLFVLEKDAQKAMEVLKKLQEGCCVEKR